MNSPNHTRANVRIKFPDGMLLQGTFGAKEMVSDIYSFVQENLFYEADKRAFYLYETPPKKELGADAKDMKNTLIQKKLVPSCLLYFGWRDLDETKAEHGPFLHMEKLKDKVVNL